MAAGGGVINLAIDRNEPDYPRVGQRIVAYKVVDDRPPSRIDTIRQRRCYVDMHAERKRAHDKHDHKGESMERRTWSDPAWMPTLLEEVGEVAKALNEYRHGNWTMGELEAELRDELVQVGAMTAAWIDALDDAT